MTTPRRRLAIGVDFGTESGRVLVLDLASGEEVAVRAVAYPHGVIDERLPSNGAELAPDTALQDPNDYLDVLARGVPEAMREADARAEEVIGLGVDVTACTVLPVTEDGSPLCQIERWRDHPFAWVKLWKHHSAQPVADRLNAVAVERGERFLDRYGGRLSSEWYFPKLIETWLVDRDVFDAMDRSVEATDWIVWQLTGELVRELHRGVQGVLVGARRHPLARLLCRRVPRNPRPHRKARHGLLSAGTPRRDVASENGRAPRSHAPVRDRRRQRRLVRLDARHRR